MCLFSALKTSIKLLTLGYLARKPRRHHRLAVTRGKEKRFFLGRGNFVQQ